MNYFDTIKLAINSLRKNKLRAFLTMLGIIIGISSVITITTIGNTIESTLKKEFDTLGINKIEAYVYFDYDENEEYVEPTDDDFIPQEVLDKLLEQFKDTIELAFVEPYGDAKTVGKTGKEVKYSVNTATEAGIKSEKLELIYGRLITDKDNKENKNTIVVSDKFVEKYFGKLENVIGKTVDLTVGYEENEVNDEFTIVGVYKYKQQSVLGFSISDDAATNIYLPLDSVYRLFGTDRGNYSYIMLTYDIKQNSDVLKYQLKDFFKKNYKNDNFEIDVMFLSEEVKSITQVLSYITIAISVIAAISLIVGGVGVMNIMLVSVVERTKEIGIEKALGAKNSDIKRQFMIEAITICIIGGIIGIALGILNGYLLSKLGGYLLNSVVKTETNIVLDVAVSYTAIVVSTLFSILIGVFFGLYPANKAAKLDPIEALRYE